jgi:hypothetical protein
MPIKPKTAFLIFLDEFALLHRAEYDKYHVFTAVASDAWRKLDTNTKKNYEQLSRLQLKAYENETKLA